MSDLERVLGDLERHEDSTADNPPQKWAHCVLTCTCPSHRDCNQQPAGDEHERVCRRDASVQNVLGRFKFGTVVRAVTVIRLIEADQFCRFAVALTPAPPGAAMVIVGALV